jgi:hypothetical protein
MYVFDRVLHAQHQNCSSELGSVAISVAAGLIGQDLMYTCKFLALCSTLTCEFCEALYLHTSGPLNPNAFEKHFVLASVRILTRTLPCQSYLVMQSQKNW